MKTVHERIDISIKPQQACYRGSYHISNNKEERGNETWIRTKTLGTNACTTTDIKRRINLGNQAFGKYKSIWGRNKHLKDETKLRIYEATVVSVMLYNSGTWAAPKNVIEQLDASHRKHIKSILNIKWHTKINNEDV